MSQQLESVSEPRVAARHLFRVEEVAEILAMSKSTVRALTARGELPCRRIGRLVRYAKDDIDFFVRSRQDFPYR
jgi:excisionase family DNA binding protein